MLHSCYQRLRPLTPHIWWQFNDWLDNLSWNFFYLKNWLLLKYFNWHRCWAALTGRCGHGSCFMTKYKTIFSTLFCAQLSSVQLRLSAPSDGWWRCDRGQMALALAAAASYHKQYKHHTVGADKNETLVFVNFSAQGASILKISVPIIKRRSWGFQNTPNLQNLDDF